MERAANNFTANRLCPGYHRLKSQNMEVGKTYECIPENYIGFYTEDLKKYGCAFKYEYKCTLFEEPTSQQNIPQQFCQGRYYGEHHENNYVFIKNNEYRVMDDSSAKAGNEEGQPLNNRILLEDYDRGLQVRTKHRFDGWFVSMESYDLHNLKFSQNPKEILVQFGRCGMYLAGMLADGRQWCISTQFNNDGWETPIYYVEQTTLLHQSEWSWLHDADITTQMIEWGIRLEKDRIDSNTIYEHLTADPELSLKFIGRAEEKIANICSWGHENWLIGRLRHFNLTHNK